MPLLPRSDIDQWCAVHTAWTTDGTSLSRTYRFPTFHRAIAFVVQAGMLADTADHHPDLDVRYNRVIATLSTHSAGGVTDKDLALADALDTAAGEAVADGNAG